MRYLVLLSATMLLAACWIAPVQHNESQPASPPDSTVQFLLTSAATDFHTHGPTGPLRFRDVRLGHVLTPSGEAQYRLCGQYLQTQAGDKAEWTPFVTIKTSGYEQYLGGSSWCEDPKMVWDEVENLSDSLQSRFDSSR